MIASGFALMKSAALVPAGFLKAKNCIDLPTLRAMHGACTPEELTALQQCTDRFFSRPAVLQSTPSRQDAWPARVLKLARVIKPSNEIADAWQVIIDRRRLAEPDDTRPIQNYTTRKNMHSTWMHAWFNGKDEHGVWNLTEKQHYLPERKKTSIFCAYLNNNFGGKNFVMAVIQTGMQWAPTANQINTDYGGALEHVAKNFASWARRLARAVGEHQRDPRTIEATTRSGAPGSGKHGLTAEEEKNRTERNRLLYASIRGNTSLLIIKSKT